MLRVCARKRRILVLNGYPDPPFPKSCIRPWTLEYVYMFDMILKSLIKSVDSEAICVLIQIQHVHSSLS